MTLIIIFILLGAISSIGGAVSKAYRRAQKLLVPSAPAGGAPIPQRLEKKAEPPGAASPAGAGKRRLAPAPPPSRRSAGERDSRVRSSLERVFSEEEQLLAAFIFHEVLGPPRSLRRR